MIMIMFLLYDHNANLLKHAQDLRNTEIPVPILNTLNTTYNGYDINHPPFRLSARFTIMAFLTNLIFRRLILL